MHEMPQAGEPTKLSRGKPDDPDNRRDGSPRLVVTYGHTARTDKTSRHGQCVMQNYLYATGQTAGWVPMSPNTIPSDAAAAPELPATGSAGGCGLQICHLGLRASSHRSAEGRPASRSTPDPPTARLPTVYAGRIGRVPSTVSRELRRNAATRGGKLEYRASVTQWKAELLARRPKTAKLVANDRLRAAQAANARPNAVAAPRTARTDSTRRIGDTRQCPAPLAPDSQPVGVHRKSAAERPAGHLRG